MNDRLSLEELLTSPAGFALVTASPLQRAVCRVIDGLPLGDLALREDVRAAVGDVDSLPSSPPGEVMMLSGIRAAKSLIAAAVAVRVSQTCDVSGLGAGETPRVSVVSLTADLAKVVFGHIIGNVLARPALRALMVGEPTADTVSLMHPSGRVIEIKVVAGARAGASLVARWSAGCIFDEAPRMIGAEDGVVNFDDCRAAVLGRLLPGAQIISIGSPWAPFGPVYEMVQEFSGKPSAQLVVVRAPAPAMNPVYWTPARIAELKAKDPQVYRTDILGEFADPETSLFSSEELARVTRASGAELPREPNHFYEAAMDPGTRSNAWTLVVVTKKRIDESSLRIKHVVVLARQWQGAAGAPLSADATLREIAGILAGYGVTSVVSDQWSADALRDIARRYDLTLWDKAVTAPLKVAMYENLRTLVNEQAIELPTDPVLRGDLLSIRKRVTQSGITIELPRTADGRHADYAPALALAIERGVQEPRVPKPPGPKFGSREWHLLRAVLDREEAIMGSMRKPDGPWFAKF